MGLAVYDSGECEVLVRTDFLNRNGKNQDIIYCDEVQRRDCYRIRDLARSGFQPKVVVDIGAQIGTFSMLVHKHWPRTNIHCFEPVAAQFEVLRRNIPSAQATRTAVIGFYGKESQAELHKCSYHRNDPEAPYRERRRSALCVDQILEYGKIGAIDLLKLDCEECEVNILREFLALNRIRDVTLIRGEWHGGAARELLTQSVAETHHVEVTSLSNVNGLFFCTRK